MLAQEIDQTDLALENRVSDGSGRAGVGRRELLKASGVGAAALALGAPASGAEAAPVRAAARPAATSPNLVNLFVEADASDFSVGGSATLNITIGNLASVAATGPVSLKVVTPFFADVPVLPSVKGGTSQWLYHNPAPNVPSVFQVSFNGFPANSTKTVAVSFSLEANSPNVPPISNAIFTTTAGNTQDSDTDLSRNVWTYGFVRDALATEPTGSVNLFFTADMQPVVAGGSAVNVPFHFFNGAGSLLHGTQSPSLFTFSTPFYMEVASSGRPAGLASLYSNSDPAIPSVWQLAVPAGIGSLGATTPTTVSIPFQAHAGGPRKTLCASGMIYPTGSDSQGDFSTSHSDFNLLSVIDQAV
ncbi:MAG: twin-arginine translocation signal domain-containing protein [Streptomyces sp.]|nr:twin-arginine translocation signal domain-containing protein [Streptomyces sp.]